MNTLQIRALYDVDQRKNIVFDDGWREVDDQQENGIVVRLLGKNHLYGAVVYSELNADNADAAIQRQLKDLKGRVDFLEWKLFMHDAPQDLLQRLENAGFQAEEEEAIMVLDIENVPEMLMQPVTHDIRHITNESGIKEIIKVQNEVEMEDMSWLGNELIAMLNDGPEGISIYGAWMDGNAVSSAWMRTPKNSQFASLWGGSTLPAYRKKGLFTALVATRVQEAKRRGYRYITVDASPMSRPILEKHGFHVIGTSIPCVYHFDES